MTAQSAFYTLPHGNGYDALEVHACFDNGEATEQVDDGLELPEGGFFTLYGHMPGAGNEAIGDFRTFEAACDVAEKLGGKALFDQPGGMKRRVTLTYSWWRTCAPETPILSEHVEQLEESALIRVAALYKAGFTEGQLHESRVPPDGKHGVFTYSGYWSIQTEEL